MSAYRLRLPRFLVILVVLLLLVLVGTSCASGTSPSQSTERKLQATLKAQLAKYKVPGAIVGMWFPSTGDWVVGSGTANKSTGATPKTTGKIRIGSLTKTFTATTVLMLADQGKLSLNDKLSKYEPQVPGEDGITVRQLLNMTSGLFNYTEDQAFWTKFAQNPRAVWTPQQLVDLATAHPANFPPDQKYEYCNTNYILLGIIIEKVTGKPAGREIKSMIIDRLGLKNTSFPVATAMPSPYMHGYTPAPTAAGNDTSDLMDFSICSPTAFYTAGVMISNLDDLKVWVKALGDGALLSGKMHNQQVKFSAPNTNAYGLGVMNASNIFLGHSGEVPGYNSSMY